SRDTPPVAQRRAGGRAQGPLEAVVRAVSGAWPEEDPGAGDPGPQAGQDRLCPDEEAGGLHPSNCLKALAGQHRISHRFRRAYTFFTNSDFSFMAPMPSILQSMSWSPSHRRMFFTL